MQDAADLDLHCLRVRLVLLLVATHQALEVGDAVQARLLCVLLSLVLQLQPPALSRQSGLLTRPKWQPTLEGLECALSSHIQCTSTTLNADEKVEVWAYGVL